MALSLFGSAGTFAWPMAWALMAVFALFSVAGFALLPPELIVERSRLPADARPLDLLIGGLAILLLIPATAVVSGLDARWHWSPALPVAVRVAALAIFVLGYAVSLWAAWANPFFSAVVRIQRERGHHVVSRGPYAVVRHPGYAGPLLAHVCLPLALGSLWGLLPALGGCACLVLRIGFEERVLRAELAGYVEYAQRVRWRLLPYVW
jgi:protein-S-isoprenylcysteine O-methyltransferase Ste14